MVNQFANSVVDRSADLIPFSIYPKLIRRDLIDIFYHVVSNEDLTYVRHLYPVIPVDYFQQSLDYLASQYRFISYEQVQAHILAGKPLPEDALHLSFDDGYRQCFDVVRPILLERGIPATFFLTTSLIDNQVLFYRNKVSLAIDWVIRLQDERRKAAFGEISRIAGVTFHEVDGFRDWIKELRAPDEDTIDAVLDALGIDVPLFLAENQPYLTQPQIRTMVEEGFCIGAHTITHRKLGGLNPSEAEYEIVESCRAILRITGQKDVPLSFPHSGAGLSRELLRNIRQQHPWVGLFFDTKGLHVDIPIVVNRIWGERTPDRVHQTTPVRQIILHAYREQWPKSVKALLRGAG